MRKIYLFIFTSFLTLGFNACNVINPSEVVPTYVQIDSFSFSGDVSKTGSLSHKITNVWVYFNNAPVGNFDLPAKFPVIATQPGTLTLLAGIDYDGLTGIESIYPLYLPGKLDIVPSPGKVIPFTPAIGYNDNVKLKYSENFDGATGPTNNTFARDLGADTILNTTDSVFEGHGSGVLHLPVGKDSAIVYSGPINDIAQGNDAFIELDYKGTLNLRVGMYADDGINEVYQEQLIGLYHRDHWGKIYVDIKTFIAEHQNATYRILLRADKPAGVTAGDLFVDNVKVVSY